MKMKHLFVGFVVAIVFTATVQAQTVSFGTSPQGGANNALCTALGKIVNEKYGLKIRIVPMAGTEQFAPMIDAGRMDVAVASSTDVKFAHDGLVTFKGRPQRNLRAIASLYAFQVAFLVRRDSPIKRISELKGKRVPIKFTNQKAAHRHFLAAAASAGLTEDDFKGVPVPNVIRAAQDFVQGKLDATWFAVGAGKVKEMAAQVGGIRYLPAETSPEALARMRKIAPAAYIEIAQPRKSAPGIVGPTPVITENYMLFGGKHVSDDVVAKFLDTLHTEKSRLSSAFARWKRYDPNVLAKNVEGLKWHPGAVKWLKANGMWPPK
jgi:hypothetical protein